MGSSRSLRVQQIDREILRPAVLFQQFFVLGRRVARTGIGRIALHDRCADRLNDRSPELRVQKILISLFAGMYLRRNLARERRIQRVQHLHDLFRRNLSRKINL